MSRNTETAQILNSLLSQISAIDFEEVARTKFNTKEAVKRRQTIVIVIEQLLEISTTHNWHLTKLNNSVYLYNGCFWEIIPEDQFKKFLCECALKMGVKILEAKYHLFQKDLYLQFLSQSWFEVEEPEEKILINLQNGTLEIEKGKVNLRDFSYKDFLKYQLPFEYNPKAKSPLFDKFINEVLEDKDSQKVVAEFLSSIFINNKTLKIEKTLILCGTGSNGKSVLFDIINALLGNENVSNYSLDSLLDPNGYYRSALANSLLNYSSELSKKRIESATFKQLVSCEPIEARLPYGQPMTISNYARLMFNTNQLPDIAETTNAMYRRLIIVNFTKTIEEKDQDRELATKIINNELSGVFNWILEGLERLINQKGFTESELIKEAINSYKITSDNVLQFLEDYEPSLKHKIPLIELYKNYDWFCTISNYKPLSNIEFSKKLESLKFEKKRTNKGYSFYIKRKYHETEI